MLKGIPASSGIAIGKAFVVNKTNYEITDSKIQEMQIEEEIKVFHAALTTCKEQLEQIREETEKNLGYEHAAIFEAHILMLEDEELIPAVLHKISFEKYNAVYALKLTMDEFLVIFDGMDDDYMRERAADIRDVRDRLYKIMLNITDSTKLGSMKEKVIVVTKDLSPSDTASMDRDKVLGFVTEIGGRTSHSAIMARTLEIPAILGIGDKLENIKMGDLLIIDGDEGVIIINPEENTIKEYIHKQEKLEKYKQELHIFRDKQTISQDGKVVELVANIGSVEDVEFAILNGAEGIGLFRTEFLYMNKTSLPEEEEQFEAYKAVLTIMKDKPVVIRTLDIGGDKKLPYLPIAEEMNPFLGYRAIRLCLDIREIFITQLRALLRSSIYGNLKIMFPMISCLEELMEAKKLLEAVKDSLRSEGIPINEKLEIGIMIEIPSAAIMSDILAKEVDFFSIGTNDLIQYTVAVDRMNEKVAYLYNPYNPAVLRLIKNVIDNAHKNNKWVGMCGEVAGDVKLIPVLLGFGLDEFSMAAPSILEARKTIGGISYKASVNLAQEVLEQSTSEKIKEKIKEFIF